MLFKNLNLKYKWKQIIVICIILLDLLKKKTYIQQKSSENLGSYILCYYVITTEYNKIFVKAHAVLSSIASSKSRIYMNTDIFLYNKI